MPLLSGKMISCTGLRCNNTSKISAAHVDGVLAGERGIGGLLAKLINQASQRASLRITRMRRLPPIISVVVWSVI